LPRGERLRYDAFEMPMEFVFLQPGTQRLRSGWRVSIFVFVFMLPQLLLSLFAGQQAANATEAANKTFAVDWAMIAVYVLMAAWVAVVSMACWYWLDGLSWRAWGYQFHQGCWRDTVLGILAGALMILGVVFVQVLSGGTRVQWNPQSFGQLSVALVSTAILLWLAAAFEELLFRGYAFQTLLNDCPAWLPMVLLAVFFGLAHWTNSSRTIFSTFNTALAGVWLSAAVLRTRSLWLATGLHFSWNWVTGAVFGLPVSGMLLPHPLLLSTSQSPLWVTGGSYGSEGGITATIAFALGTFWLWRSSRLTIAPETALSLTNQSAQLPDTLSLRLDK
jgi:membrane protease YdiL (CAAX protease family)